MTVTVSADVAHTDFEAAEFLDHAKVVYITPADLAAGVYELALPLGAVVTNVRTLVLTAFDGTTPAVIVGDSDDDNGYFVTTVVDPTTAGDYQQSIIAGGALKNGKAYLAAPGLFLVTFSQTDSTTGKLRVDIVLAGRDQAPLRADLINNF